MRSHRTHWLRWGTGVVVLLALAGWVFWASLREQNKPRSSFGSGASNWSPQEEGPFRPVDPNAHAGNPGYDPHVQETLRTINEINRINKMNMDLRKKEPASADPLIVNPKQPKSPPEAEQAPKNNAEKP